jgi:uncharacterized integral membrane protein
MVAGKKKAFALYLSIVAQRKNKRRHWLILFLPCLLFVCFLVAMNKLIVTYSMVNTTTAYFNTFDTATNTWAGLGLVGVPSTSGNSGNSGKSSTPLGAIIGGVVGGLVVIALVAFLFIRNKRRKIAKAAKKDIDGHSGAKNGKAESEDGDHQTPHVYTYVPEIVPAPIVQQPVFFDPNQQHQQQVAATNAAYYNPNATAVYDQNAAAALNVYDPNAHIYDQGLNTYQVPGTGAYPPPPPQPAATPYNPIPPSPYQDPAMSPYSSQATKTGSPAPANPQFVEPESYASPKIVGSPQYVDVREPYKVEAREGYKGGNEPEYYRP